LLEQNDLIFNIQDEGKSEFEKAEFNRIKRLYFETFLSGNKTPTEKIIEMKQFYANCDAPYNSEPFVLEQDTPFLWVWDNPYIITFENEFKEKLSLFRAKHIDLKRHFAKIFLEEDKSKKETNLKLFLGIAKSFFGINHILIPLFKALVFLFNKSSINYSLALKELDEAESMLVYLDPKKSSKNVFKYFVHLYKAFCLMKQQNWIEADDNLTCALLSNPNGINAYFARLYIYTATNNSIGIEDALNKILSYDIEKIKVPISKNNLAQFYYFLQNPTLPNIFNIIFLASSNKIINKVLAANFEKKISFDNLEQRIAAINEINFVDYIDEKFVDEMIFLNHIFTDKNSINQVYFYLIIPILEEKFLKLVENLKENIKKKHYADLLSKISEYDRRIKEYDLKKNEIEDETIKSKAEIEKRMQESIKLFDESITNAINESEALLSSVDTEPKLNAFEAFQNSMIYNFVASLLVFVIAALANYLNSDYLNSNSYSLASYLIINGIKWAAITFLVGVVISIFYSFFIVLEKTSYRLNLKKKIAQLKREKEFNIEIIRKDFQKKISALEEEKIQRIDSINKKIEELKKEKSENENSLKAKADKIIKPLMDKINIALNLKNPLNNSSISSD